MEACSREEELAVIHFLRSENVEPPDIHPTVNIQCEDTLVYHGHVCEW